MERLRVGIPNWGLIRNVCTLIAWVCIHRRPSSYYKLAIRRGGVVLNGFSYCSLPSRLFIEIGLDSVSLSKDRIVMSPNVKAS